MGPAPEKEPAGETAKLGKVLAGSDVGLGEVWGFSECWGDADGVNGSWWDGLKVIAALKKGGLSGCGARKIPDCEILMFLARMRVLNFGDGVWVELSDA